MRANGCLPRPGRWPRKLRLAFEAIVTVFMNSYQTARSRAAGSPSKTVRLLAELDEANLRIGLLERELGIQRRRIEAVAPERRPRVLADDRLQLLVLVEMLGLSIKQGARRFVLHRNTLGRWWRVLRGGKDPGGFLGAAPFNKIADSVRWLVHEFRDECWHLGWGTRAIASRIVQLGIQISRTSVQRILSEEKPKRPARVRSAEDEAPARATGHILHPKKRNRTWHIDLTALDIFGMRFHVAALLDGFSRKLLALKVYARTPTAAMTAALVKRVARRVGEAPRFIVTDHGTQFLARFEGLLVLVEGTDIIRCRVGDFHLNGKVERFFRTFKWWARRKLWAWFASRTTIARAIQRRLDAFKDWYNERPHQGLAGLTPDQAWAGVKRLKTKPIRAHDPQPDFAVTRRRFRGDSHLPVVEVTIDWPEAA
jgi:transposase InsO family protein